jgi:hypothetical protein
MSASRCVATSRPASSACIGDGDNPGVVQPNDPFVSDTQSIGIRRGRLVLSGDVTDHLYLYLQSDYMAGVGGVNALAGP